MQPTPAVRLYTEKVRVDVGDGLVPSYEKVDAPMVALSFDYAGIRVPASDPCERAYGSADQGLSYLRDPDAETAARHVLESLGAVDLFEVQDCVPKTNSEADYLVRVDGDVDALCSFSTYAVPQLQAMGWAVTVDDNYKWKVVQGEIDWYADIDAGSKEDWFAFELGFRVGDRRINILPALLDLLEQTSSLAQTPRRWRRFKALRVGKGEYVAVPGECLERVMQVLTELYQGEKTRGRLPVHEAHAGALLPLQSAFGGASLSWTGDTRVLDHGAAIASRPTLVPKDKLGDLRATLRPYQSEGLAFLQRLRTTGVGGILADDMGLGKTLQTIAHLTVEKASARLTKPALVVCPTSLVRNWQSELARFSPLLKTVVYHGPHRRHVLGHLAQADVVITTYPLVTRDCETLSELSFYLIVLDEAQTIKNSRGQAHKAVCEIDAKHRLCLSGTPMENNIEELWSLFQFLIPGLLGDINHFRSYYRIPIEREKKQRPLDALRDRVQPFVLRRRKEEVEKELPTKTEIMRAVDISGAQRDLYESIRVAAHAKVRSLIREKGIAGSTIAILDALLKLRQVCCDPRLARFEAARGVTESAKYELLFEMLPAFLHQGRRILLFSQFTSMLDLIAGGLDERGIRHVTIRGSTRDRQAPIDTFARGEANVFLLSLKAAGTGLNLTHADTVIHYDPWWNPAAHAQATDRAHRIGQTKPVFVYNLIVAGSVEEQMLRLQKRKRDLAESIIDAGAGGLDLSHADVNGLFAPLHTGTGSPLVTV